MRLLGRRKQRVFVLYDHTYVDREYTGIWNLIGIFSTEQKAEIARDHLQLPNPAIKAYEVDWRYEHLPPVYVERPDANTPSVLIDGETTGPARDKRVS